MCVCVGVCGCGGCGGCEGVGVCVCIPHHEHLVDWIRQEQRDVGQHVAHGQPVDGKGTDPLEVHEDVIDGGVLDPLEGVAHGVAAEHQDDCPPVLAHLDRELSVQDSE